MKSVLFETSALGVLSTVAKCHVPACGYTHQLCLMPISADAKDRQEFFRLCLSRRLQKYGINPPQGVPTDSR
jgi:hypothetical protein